MAILAGGPNGGFSGKAGSVVGYYQHGKWVIRGLPKLSPKNKKGSANQNVCRSKFSVMQSFLKPIILFIRIGFNMEAKKNGNTAHNSCKSYNMLNAFDENGKINYAAVRVSAGNLIGAVDVVIELVDEEVVFTWRDNSKEGSERGWGDERENDQIMILGYHDGEIKNLFGTISGERRSAGRQAIRISRNSLPWEYHVWVSFISDDRQLISNSIYAGTVTY